MNTCPDKETLEKFVEYELDDALNRDILDHLAGCGACKDVISQLLESEEHLIKSLTTKTLMSKKPEKKPRGTCITDAGLLAYAVDSLYPDQLKLVEKHLDKCDNCLKKLMMLQKQLAVPADLGLDFSQFKFAAAAVPVFLEIVLKAKDDLLDLIRHTGELLTLTPQIGAVRGREQKAEKSIAIRQDFPQQDLSIEITIQRRMSKSGGIATISLMKLSTEEFLAGKDVSLVSDRNTYSNKTNAEGITTFSGIGKMKYDVMVEGNRIGGLSIN